MNKATKKKFKDTKLGKFLKDKAPNILDKVGEFLPDSGALGIVKNIIDQDTEISPEDKAKALDLLEVELRAFSLEVEDRKDARQLFKEDSLLQKVFSIVFLVSYGALSLYLLKILATPEEFNELFKTMVTMIWTGTSTKLNTIIDFLFGGSFNDNK